MPPVEVDALPQLLKDLRDLAPWMLSAVVAFAVVKWALPPCLHGIADVIRAMRGK